MRSLNIKKLGLILSGIFLGLLLMESCAASRPGFSSGNKKKGNKVRSSGKMYR